MLKNSVEDDGNLIHVQNSKEIRYLPKEEACLKHLN